MVKFSKELEAQLIPEWKDAFVNYWQLKKQIKKIKVSRLFNFDNKLTEIIQVKSKIIKDGEDEEIYETELAQLFSEEDEVRVFFERLDEELNKVNQFYKTKETEFLERGEILNKQLQILLDLKQILNDRRWKNSLSKPKYPSIPSSWSSTPRNSDYSSENSEELSATPTSTEPTQTDEAIAALERNGVSFTNTATRGHGEFINRKKIQCAEKMIRGAFVELYRGLGLLKTYSSLNMVAFTKILKKFDKVRYGIEPAASASYLKAVKRSHFISSDKVVRLMDEVETIFTSTSPTMTRKKAMKFLRPQRHKESHMVTFFVGLLTGCFVSLFSVYALLAHLVCVFALLSLHLFMYGCNLFMWKSTRINCNFIFEVPNQAPP
ncbi:hypothetical protein M0R45_018498 [Rubus argutus]|uniref:SPX domain-containing protein n=1 Tax=Rubus argutus TaxID=59490 RepID=A0AAW1X552_RUBAR